jgi:hypothetical protein
MLSLNRRRRRVLSGSRWPGEMEDKEFDPRTSFKTICDTCWVRYQHLDSAKRWTLYVQQSPQKFVRFGATYAEQ